MLQPGDLIDIWVIQKALGSGGMGSVYRCHNKNAKRILAAVKVLDSSLRKYPEAEARFIREAEILFQLDHPNIVKVRNVRTDADPPYLEMEFVEGESLEERLRRGALPFEQAVDYITQITAAIAYLHKKGVCHRDIKPANLLVTSDNRVKLVDFGLAMEADATRITQSGMTFGTVSYAPPEWIAPDTLDPRKWDLYAAGVVFFEMLTGRLAFPVSGQGSARQQAMQVIVGKQGHDPLDPGEQFHDDIRALLADLTRPDAGKRLSSAAEAVRRSRELVRTLRRQPGVTLAPLGDEAWADDGLDVSPEAAPDRPESNTWLSTTDVGAKGREQGPVTDEIPTQEAAGEAPPAEPPIGPESRRSGAVSMAPAAGLGLGVALVGAVGLVGLVAVGAATAWWFANQSGPSRPVEVAVTGLAPDSPVHVTLDGQAPTAVDGLRFQFAEAAIGEPTLRWTLGEGCADATCPGSDCPVWCGSDTVDVTVKPGTEPQVVFVDIQAPVGRPVGLALPELSEDIPVAATLAGRPGIREGTSVRFDAVPPGAHDLVIAAGACPEDAADCWPDGTCPAGCTAATEAIAVPWGDGEHAHTLALPTPSKPSGSPGPRPQPGPKPDPGPAPEPAPSAGGSSPITVGQFAAWLGSHPDWQREAAIGAGRAKAGYLPGWDGATPPASAKPHHAVQGISWFAATAFCKSRGGLLDVGAEPTRWTEGASQPYIEYRVKGGQAAWRTSDGRDSSQVGGADVVAMTGFRCAN